MRLAHRDIYRVALRRAREIDDERGDRKLAFRGAEALIGIPGIEREAECARIGKPDVFDRHAHRPARKVQRIAAAIEHAAQPVRAQRPDRVPRTALCSAEIWS